MATTSVVPSSQACELYVEMALRAESAHLSLVDTLVLAVDRVKHGRPNDADEVVELLDRGWIAQADDGGWNIRHQ